MIQTQKIKDIYQKARDNFDKVQTALQDERTQCVDDRRFYSIAGAQWEGKYNDQFENKPKFEINKIHLSVIRIFNEYRNNRITVDFLAKDGSDRDELADACDGLYRACEDNSSAEEAYDNAFEEAVGGGFGAFRLITQYEDEFDEENEKQCILIEPIYDADTSVYFDLNAKKYDKSDAKFAYIVSSYTPDEFREQWNEDPTSWPKEVREGDFFDWSTANIVYVAEYYEVEEKDTSIYIYKTLLGEEKKYTDQDFANDFRLEATLKASGIKFERERKVKEKRIHKYIMSGNGILEDNGYIAGKNIPIVPMYGKRWFVDNIERCMGHVRLSKDAQRIKNMLTSKFGELSALSSVEKPILTPEQIAGHQLLWQDDNIKN